MTSDENLNKIYEGVINGIELTTKELNSYGFSSKDLSDLITNNTLERVKRGYYKLASVDGLFMYGKKLISLKKDVKATVCFEKCYELDPNHKGACFQLFFRKIKSLEYDEAFKYFDEFSDNDNPFYNADSNFYLYLLSNITDIPDKYKEYVKSLEFIDIRVDFMDKRYEDKTAYNAIRSDAFNKKFIKAFKKLINLTDTSTREKLTFQDLITKTLLEQAIEKQKKVKKEINTLIINKQYEDVIAYLESIEKNTNLSFIDKYTLQLTKDLVDIINTNKVPKKRGVYNANMFVAIDAKDYALALTLSEKFISEENIEKSDNAINILLTEINNVLRKISNNDKTIETPKEKKLDVSTSNTCKVVESVTNKTQQNNNNFTNIINYLMNNDIDNSFIALKSYLESINKKEYEFLITDLIKLSLVEHDIAFAKPMIALTYISKGNYQFNVSEYIKEFYIALSQNMFDAARIYVDIISDSDKLGQQFVSTNELKQILTIAEDIINNKEVDDSPKTIEEINDEQQMQYINEEISQENEDIEEGLTESNEEEYDEENNDFDVKSFIDQRLNELHENGIILLKPMDNTKRKSIHEYIKCLPDVASFSIGEGEVRQIVLRHKLNEYIDIPKIAKEGNEAYNSYNYDLCIEKFRKLLGINNPKTWVYARLGLAYIKINNKKMAIDYLTIATELEKKEGNSNKDYTELIASLKGLIPEEDRKPRVKMNISEFEDDMNNNYGIDNLDEIIRLLSTGTSLEEVTETMNLSLNQRNIVALLLAKDCYSNEDYDIGDMYIKLIQETKGKSKKTIDLLDEVRKNKQFYKYRRIDG